MRNRLADNLNLGGTATFNIAMRHKRSLILTNENPQNKKDLLEKRKRIPAAWEKVVPFLNHSELWHANNLAKSVGCAHPFPNAEILPADNGERFFSEHMSTLKEIGKKRGADGECVCKLCDPTIAASNNSQPRQPQQQLTNRIGETTTEGNTTAATPRQHPPNARHAHVERAPAIAMQQQMRQQQQQQQQQQHQRQFNITPYQQPMLLPCWCFSPMLTTRTPACCSKCSEWLSRPRRVGRPPHHPLCSKR